MYCLLDTPLALLSVAAYATPNFDGKFHHSRTWLNVKFTIDMSYECQSICIAHADLCDYVVPDPPGAIRLSSRKIPPLGTILGLKHSPREWNGNYVARTKPPYHVYKCFLVTMVHAIAKRHSARFDMLSSTPIPCELHVVPDGEPLVITNGAPIDNIITLFYFRVTEQGLYHPSHILACTMVTLVRVFQKQYLVHNTDTGFLDLRLHASISCCVISS